MNIKRISRESIDVSKWDSLVRRAYNSLPYGYAWYLDAVSEHWEALILNDYDAILPLPFVKKMGFKLFVQPLFCQQLGPFSIRPLKEEEINCFLDSLPTQALRLNLSFSSGIQIPEKFSFLNPKQRINQIIDLDEDLDSIRKNYSKSTRKKLRNHGHQYADLEEIEDFEEVIKFYKRHLESKVSLQDNGYKIAARLFESAKENNAAFFYQIKNKKSNTWISKGMLITDEKRVINLFSATLKSEQGASRKNIDSLIEKFHEQKSIFDFEGSSIPGINEFFSSFGSKTTNYYTIDKVHPLLNLIYKLKALIK